jgi:hypothetical protein
LVLRALMELLWIDFYLVRGFPKVYEAVRNVRVQCLRTHTLSESTICHAVDVACVFYFKEVRCLQRSAAATRLLRHSSIAAEMVIGAQACPFRAHAWVEVAGRVVNDKAYVSDLYAVMDRC